MSCDDYLDIRALLHELAQVPDQPKLQLRVEVRFRLLNEHGRVEELGIERVGVRIGRLIRNGEPFSCVNYRAARSVPRGCVRGHRTIAAWGR